MNKKNGFTLVEAIVVVVVLAILVGVSIKGVYTWIDKAKVKTDINNLKEIEDAFNTCLQDEEFPIGEKGYSIVFLSETSTSTGNIFDDFVIVRPDIVNGYSIGTSRTGAYAWQGIELYNGNVAYHTDLRNIITSSLKIINNKVISKMNTKYKVFCVISIDEGGNFVQAKCGLTNLPRESTFDWYEGLGGRYYYKQDELTDSCRNLAKNLANTYIIYDGDIDLLS